MSTAQPAQCYHLFFFAIRKSHDEFSDVFLYLFNKAFGDKTVTHDQPGLFGPKLSPNGGKNKMFRDSLGSLLIATTFYITPSFN